MSKIKDLKGLSFGKLQVVEEHPERAKNSSAQWQCLCECGNVRVYPSYELHIGRHTSCGCSKEERDAVSEGDVFGKLTTLYSHTTYSKIRNRKSVYWVCFCKCGNQEVFRETEIVNKVRNSCGCSKVGHGESPTNGRTPEYISWSAAYGRCYNESDYSYENYGGRGIVMSERWKESYDNFLKDMGRRPSPKHSLDRIDVNGNYEPNNCRWADKVTQSRNQRTGKANTSGFRGVDQPSRQYADGRPRWRARISTDNGRVELGVFKSLAEAAQARKDAEEKYWNNHTN